MIYLLIFIYLLSCSIYFDILGKGGHKELHYRIAVILLILVAGLRWRVGSDTVAYAGAFNSCHDLFHLELSDFESVFNMPLWVLLRAVCKTIWNDFLLFQFVIAAFGIGMIGHFIRKACPSLCFFVLLCYFTGSFYTHIHFELLRASLSLGFFLLGILAVNDGKTKKVLLYFLVAALFHMFTVFAVFLFVIGYYLIPRKPAIYWILCAALIVPILAGKDFIAPMIERTSLYLPNEEFASRITAYSISEVYGNNDKSTIMYVWMVAQLIVYVFMLHKTQVIYPQYIRLKQDLFQTCVCISLLLACARYGLMILYRVIDYFYFFTLFLSVIFGKGILIDRIVRRQKVLVFCVLLLFPLFFGAKTWLSEDIIGEGYNYSRYYPYSSVFDKSLDPKREKHHQLRGEGWSRYNDY